MEISRDLGIGVVMIIPTFVGGGAVWDIFGNWIAVIVWIIIMICLYGRILSKKYNWQLPGNR